MKVLKGGHQLEMRGHLDYNINNLRAGWVDVGRARMIRYRVFTTFGIRYLLEAR